jgi:hypothetical protein
VHELHVAELILYRNDPLARIEIQPVGDPVVGVHPVELKPVKG